MTIQEAARRYLEINRVKVLPLKGKLPDLPEGVYKWEPLRELNVLDDEKIKQYFPPSVTGIGIITGPCSGNLEVIDVDSKNDNIAGRSLVDELIYQFYAIYPDAPTFVIASTPSGGSHLYYRCSEIEPAQKLAITSPQKLILIETRGTGNYAAAYPSPKYNFCPDITRVNTDQIPTITPEQRNTLLNIARSYSQVEEPTHHRKKQQRNYTPTQEEYNKKGDPLPLIYEAGYTKVREDKERIFLRRPPAYDGDQPSAVSGNYLKKSKCLWIWSSSTDFTPQEYYPADVFRVLKCNNDPAIVDSELNKKGYGRDDKKLHTPTRWSSIMDLMSRNVKKLPTGYAQLDKVTGIVPAAVTIIAGRTGTGKTSLMLNLLIKQAQLQADKKFYFFSYEEPPENLYIKLLSIIANKEIKVKGEGLTPGSYDAIKYHFREGTYSQDAELSRAIETIGEMVDSNRIEIVGENYPVEELCEIITNRAVQENIGAVFIDYAQRIHTGEQMADSPRVNMINVSDAITKTAKNTRLPIILGSQFSRTLDAKENNETPKLYHLKESGSLEEDANNVWGLHRPAGNKEDTKTELCLYILKNREGDAPEDPIKIKWNKLEWKIN